MGPSILGAAPVFFLDVGSLFFIWCSLEVSPDSKRSIATHSRHRKIGLDFTALITRQVVE
jgi:hypothetical protein